MIYILCRYCDTEYYEMDEVIVMASSNIKSVLDYIYENIQIYNLCDYTIVALPENDPVCSACFTPDEKMYDRFISYTPSFFLWKENKIECLEAGSEMLLFCDKVKEKKEKEEKERERARKARQEQNERELYEKLKAKYGE